MTLEKHERDELGRLADDLAELCRRAERLVRCHESRDVVDRAWRVCDRLRSIHRGLPPEETWPPFHLADFIGTELIGGPTT